MSVQDHDYVQKHAKQPALGDTPSQTETTSCATAYVPLATPKRADGGDNNAEERATQAGKRHDGAGGAAGNHVPQPHVPRPAERGLRPHGGPAGRAEP